MDALGGPAHETKRSKMMAWRWGQSLPRADHDRRITVMLQILGIFDGQQYLPKVKWHQNEKKKERSEARTLKDNSNIRGHRHLFHYNRRGRREDSPSPSSPCIVMNKLRKSSALLETGRNSGWFNSLDFIAPEIYKVTVLFFFNSSQNHKLPNSGERSHRAGHCPLTSHTCIVSKREKR